MEEQKQAKIKHLPTILLGLGVALVLLVAVFSYQVNQNELAVVTTMGAVSPVSPEPGLHFRWPYPFQDVIKFDRRNRCFEGNEGKLEETQTADRVNVMVGVFVNYRIANAVDFATKLKNLAQAEVLLNSQMRAVKNAAFGKYTFDQLFNSDPAKNKLPELQQLIKTNLAAQLTGYGITVSDAGVNVINLPTAVSNQVLKRMIAGCELEAHGYLVEGQTAAQNIRLQAETESRSIVADAEAQAKEIRAKGDAEAAQHYSVFRQNPELAAFLRKLDALRKIMKSRTTLVVDTSSAPFDLFNMHSDQLPGAGKNQPAANNASSQLR